MMKTIVRGRVLLFLCAGACGGETDGRTSASGLVSEEPVFDLSASELQQLCDWVSEELGSANASDECTVETPNVVCGEVPPSCVALVEDVEACARERRAALEACEAGEDGPACARLARLCPTAVIVDDPPGCVPGQTEACACQNGTLSAQTCGTDGVWSACACESVPSSVCTTGQTAACVCTDGLAGAQTCVDENWGPCVCASPTLCVPGETRLCSCADGAAGAQVCDVGGQQWLPCQCAPTGGTCNADFCPAPNGGTPCCVTVNGPCGQDFGTGCVAPTLPGAD